MLTQQSNQQTEEIDIKSIKQAKHELMRAIEENQEELAKKINQVKKDLEVVIEHVPADKIHAAIKVEIRQLASLIETENEHLGIRSRNIKTEEKIAFIRKQLSGRGKIRKAELLELAGAHFSCDPAPTFLDTALRIGRFIKTREPDGRHILISLVELK